jgi:phosphoserine aminotransferase
MNEKVSGFPEKPSVRPLDARFSSGPCKKHPGWDVSKLNTSWLGRSHRAANPKQRLKLAIDQSHELLGLPDDWRVGIVPASDTGAFEMAMWSMLGQRPVDALVWDSFSNDWAKDLKTLGIEQLTVHEADYGMLPDLSSINQGNDLVFVYNGTTAGVRVPNLDWISNDRQGLVLCDATSAAYAMPLDFGKLDVVTWSWQKVLGSEAAHGMLALSPAAVKRLEQYNPDRPIPKIFKLTKNNALIEDIFSGATINTPSMLALEDLHSALNWANSIGGLEVLWQRCQNNYTAIDEWVNRTSWIDWLAENPEIRSPTSMCLKISDPVFQALSDDEQKVSHKKILTWLEEEAVAFDIGHYRTAPTGFRLWGGATVESSDLNALTHWLDWAYHRLINELKEQK